jgi:phosphomannomutase/phosphoglucomutase
MDFKTTLSRILKDPLLLGSTIVAGLLLVSVYIGLYKNLAVDARQKLVDFHYGLNMKIAANRVDSYIDQQRQELAALAIQTSTIDSFSSANSDILDHGENTASTIISGAEEIYFVDSAITRHSANLGFAAKHMLRLSQQGKDVDPRAIKVANQWKILFSQPVVADNSVIGTILTQMPTTGLRYALSTIDTSQGLLQLQQISAQNRSIVVLEIGDSNGQNLSRETFDTVNPLWKVTFSPSPTLLKSIENSLPPFGLFFSTIGIAILIVLYLIIRLRLGRRSLAKGIDLDTGQPNPLNERWKKSTSAHIAMEPQLKEKEPQPRTEEPQRKKKSQPKKKPQPDIEETPLETEIQTLEAATTEKAITQLEEIPSPLEQQLMQSLQSAAGDAETSSNIPDVVFRDYDIRGIADTEINADFANRLGRALGTLARRSGEETIYIGRDARLSSSELASALQAGLISCGINVVDLGELTTPTLNFAIHYGGHANSGIMVTASHNPAIYNGFKIIIQREVISGQTLQMLKPMLRGNNFAAGEGSASTADIIPQYISHIVENSLINRTFKLVIDGANCVPGPIALQLFDKLGCMAFPLYCDIDGSFPNHEPNPADEKNLVDLRERVITENADLGLAFDGDGDRVVVISAQGRVVWPDQLMMIFARDILARKPGSDIIFDVKSSKRLPELIRRYSGRPVMCKTGHAHVRKQVHDNNAPVGGEFSGHIFFNDRWKGFDDGLYAAVRLLEVLSDLGQSLDQVLDELESSASTPEILIPISESEKFDLMQTLTAGCQFDQAQVITIDGLRVEYSFGWGLIRASNTSANLTLRFEADDDSGLNQVKQKFRQELAPFINNIEDYI